MDFILRNALESDLDQCLELTTDRFLYDEEHLRALRRMWSHIITAKSGGMAVIADARLPSHVLHFGAVVFVSDERADRYHHLSYPGIAHSMVAELEAGGHPFFNREEIGLANADAGLNIVVTHHGYEPRLDESNEVLRAATYENGRRYLFGWNLRSFTNEVFARNALRDGKERGEALGFRVKRYTDAQLHGAGIPSDKGPWVWMATREDALTRPAGLTLALLFLSFSPPRFGLSFEEQETLKLALEGHTDESLGNVLGVSLSTIKKRFRRIYDKIQNASAASDAVICSESLTDGARGAEMRRGLLNYLREHREELRPYSARRVQSGALRLQSCAVVTSNHH